LKKCQIFGFLAWVVEGGGWLTGEPEYPSRDNRTSSPSLTPKSTYQQLGMFRHGITHEHQRHLCIVMPLSNR
jgi:hypothetical protein